MCSPFYILTGIFQVTVMCKGSVLFQLQYFYIRSYIFLKQTQADLMVGYMRESWSGYGAVKHPQTMTLPGLCSTPGLGFKYDFI